ncbi:hypothetical protein [Natronospora cellulosivora (SeqCode)]
MDEQKCVPGALVRTIPGDSHQIGVVKAVNGDVATVMLSKAGHDQVRDISIRHLHYPNVTEDWVAEFVALNS